MNGPNNPIGWCDFTANPVDGLCLRKCQLPDGRLYCYEYRRRQRYKLPDKVTFRENWFNKKQADKFGKKQIEDFGQRIGRSARIFVGSTHDIFGNWIPEDWIYRIIDVAAENPEHIFIYLTKNPKRTQFFDFPDNVWLGATVTNNEDTKRIAQLSITYLKGRCKTRFISFEPLLENINNEMLHMTFNRRGYGINWAIVGRLTGLKQPFDNQWVETILFRAYQDGFPVYLKENLKWKEHIKQWPK